MYQTGAVQGTRAERKDVPQQRRLMNQNPFRYFKTSREIIQIAVIMYIRSPLSLRNVEDSLHERGIDICHEGVVKGKSNTVFGAHWANVPSLIQNDFFDPTHLLSHVSQVKITFL